MFERLYGRLGPERDDILAAMIAQTFRNSQVTKKSDAKPLSDFLIPWNPPTPAFEEDQVTDGQHP